MSTPDPDTIVRQFIDGEVSDDEVQEALHRIADDPEARSLLQFELQMTQDLAASRSPQPSPEFAARILERVAETEAPQSSLRSRLGEWWRAVTRPLITVPVRPAHAVATLALVVLGVWFVFSSGPAGSPLTATNRSQPTATTMQPASSNTSSRPQTVLARFVYTDNDADSVAVAGDFSQWKPIPLSPHTVNGKTVWTGLVPVSRGEHEYQFVINGEKWVTDPLAPVKEEDGFGAKNAVLKL
ncbi:MAG: hypothetical protein ABEK84_05015 [Salinibacter sp.]